VIVATLETTPEDGSTQWSTRSMAAKVGLNQTAISRIWRTFGLKPHRVEDFKLSTDPLFVDKVRDVVGLYLNPPDAAVVLCVDEKTQVQALDRTAPVLPMLPGTPARRTYTYVRNGTSDLYAALDIASGKVLTQMTDQHRAVEFRSFLNLIDRDVPDGLAVHVICDNASTHKAPEIQRWLKRHRRFTLHYTPTYSSWLNQVERWFSVLRIAEIPHCRSPKFPRRRVGWRAGCERTSGRVGDLPVEQLCDRDCLVAARARAADADASHEAGAVVAALLAEGAGAAVVAFVDGDRPPRPVGGDDDG